jgi:hypothetical protein
MIVSRLIFNFARVHLGTQHDRAHMGSLDKLLSVQQLVRSLRGVNFVQT